MVFANREKIVQFTIEHKLPAIFEYKAFADMGGLMSYGASMAEQWRRAAYYADRILKGAKPAELPVEFRRRSSSSSTARRPPLRHRGPQVTPAAPRLVIQ